MRLPVVGALCALTLTACAVGPAYRRPTVETPAQYKETAGWKAAAPADRVPRGAWWQVFGDPELDRLEKKLDLSNQNIAQAEAQYREARAALGEAQAAFYPTVGLDAAQTRSRSVSSGSRSSNVGTVYSASLSASWEADVWGKLRRSAEAGQAAAEAGAANLENARLSAEADLAIAYFQLVVVDRQQRSLDDSVAAYREQLRVAENRFKVGVAGRSDVVEAQSQLDALQVTAIDKQRQRALLEHAIAVLVGQAPAGFSLGERTVVPKMPVLPAGVPSQLLERRPDIAAAERQVAEANARIGVARAAWFPSLTLAAAGGYNAPGFADWISLPNRVWSVGPQLAATLFDGGLRRAQNDAAVAAYDQSVAAYRQTVLAAFQEVEDNLAALRELEREAALQHRAVAAAAESAAIVANRYRAGTADMLAVSQANATLQQAQRSEFDLLNSRLTAAVGLIKALGGGFAD